MIGGRLGNTSATCAASPPRPCWKNTAGPSPTIDVAERDALPVERSEAHAAPRPSCGGRNAATAGASAADSPWVTSGPSKPAPRSAATIVPEVDHAPARRGEAPSAARSLAWAMAIRSASRSTARVDDVALRGAATPSRTDWPDRARSGAAGSASRRSAAAPPRRRRRRWRVRARCRDRRRSPPPSRSPSPSRRRGRARLPAWRCRGARATGPPGRACRCRA